MNIFRAIDRKAKSFCSPHVFLHTCFNSDYSFVTASKSFDEKDIFLNSNGTISPNLKWIGKPSALLQQHLIVKPAQASAQKNVPTKHTTLLARVDKLKNVLRGFPVNNTILASLFCIFVTPAMAVTYEITTDCKTNTTESPSSGSSATDGNVEVLPGDLVQITFKDWTSRTPSAYQSYAWEYNACGNIRYADSTSTNGYLKLQKWWANGSSEGLFARHAMPGNGTDLVLTFEAEANVETSSFQFAIGYGSGGGFEELGSGNAYSAKKVPAPVVKSVSSTSANGYYKVGDVISIDVVFSSAVTVFSAGTTPTFTLETGTTDRVATLTGGSGTTTLTFSYTVQEGDTSADLDFLSTAALDLNGSYILDDSDPNVNAVLTLPTPGATDSLSDNADIVIDGTAPVVTDGNITVSGASGPGGVFLFGDTVTVTWDPASGDGDTNLSDSTGSVTIDLSEFGGDAAAVASLVDGKWVVTYLLVSGVSNSGTNLNVSVTATDEAGNSTTVSDTSNSTVGSPESVFNDNKDDVRQVLIDAAVRSLHSNLATNQRMVQGARARFQASQSEKANCVDDPRKKDQDCKQDIKSGKTIPLNVEGTFSFADKILSTVGSFFGQQGGSDGGVSRIISGDFDVQSNNDTGSSTATFNGRVAWERIISDRTMLGYFMSGEFAQSNIDGSFNGDQTKTGVSTGVYGVHNLAENLYLDGFITLGAGRNNLKIANDVLSLTSDYTTLTQTMGTSLSGVYDYQKYEFRPELALSYGKTWIGNVGFTGRAFGLVDETLGLNAGNVSLVSLTLRPEIIWALDASTVKASNSQISFAPRLICQSITAFDRSNGCGTGAEVGITHHSDDGMGTAKFLVIMDQIGSSSSTSFALNVEQKF